VKPYKLEDAMFHAHVAVVAVGLVFVLGALVASITNVLTSGPVVDFDASSPDFTTNQGHGGSAWDLEDRRTPCQP